MSIKIQSQIDTIKQNISTQNNISFYDAEWDNQQDLLSLHYIIKPDNLTLLFLHEPNDFKSNNSEVLDQYIQFLGPNSTIESYNFWAERDLCFLFGRTLLSELLTTKSPKTSPTTYLIEKFSGGCYGNISLYHISQFTHEELIYLDFSTSNYIFKGSKRVFANQSKLFNNKKPHITIKIRDMSTYFNMSLNNSAKSVGCTISKNTDLDDYKSKMLTAYQNPELYPKLVNYAITDTLLLSELYFKFHSTITTTVKDTIGIEPVISRTIGGTVAKTFIKFLYSLHPKLQESLHRISVIDKEIPINEIQNITVKDTGVYNKKKKYNTLVDGLALCSKNYFAKTYTSTGDNGIWLALTNGGRANNEHPYNFIVENGADIDLSSCYGSSLSRFQYPIGTPSVYFPTHSTQLTLKEFYTNYKSELIDNLYTIIVSGPLGQYQQDLIPSNLLTERELRNILSNNGELTIDDVASSKILTNEIINGIITSKIWDIIEKTTYNTERQVYNNLKVVGAVYYPKSKQVNTLDEFVLSLENYIPGQFERLGYRKNRININVPSTWYSFPLKDFIGKMVEQRKFYKESKMTPQSEALKLFINTLYGVICSPYYNCGNTVVANNITASARVGVWQMNKSLGTVQSITDGGMYSLKFIRHLHLDDDSRKPSLTMLSSRNKLEKHRNICFENISNILDLKQLDKYIHTHISTFWQHYDITFDFTVEHKSVFPIASYCGAAHYYIPAPNYDSSKPKYKIRGHNSNSDFFQTDSIKLFLEQLVLLHQNNIDIFDIPHDYNTEKILSSKQIIKANQQPLSFDFLGCNITTDNIFRLNLTHLPMPNYKTFLQLKKKSEDISLYANDINGYNSDFISNYFRKTV